MQEEIKDIRTATITSKGQICIPNVARNLVGFKEGTKISVVVYNDRVELKPFQKEKLNDALMCMLKIGCQKRMKKHGKICKR